jgi:hypothetical protein
MNGIFFIIVFLSLLSKQILFLIFSKSRTQGLVEKNTRLNELRKIPIKTVEQQKEFLTIKNQKSKSTIPWYKRIHFFIMDFLISVIIFYIYFTIFKGVSIPFYISIGIIIGMSLISNKILQHFNVDNNSIWRII